MIQVLGQSENPGPAIDMRFNRIFGNRLLPSQAKEMTEKAILRIQFRSPALSKKKHLQTMAILQVWFG